MAEKPKGDKPKKSKGEKAKEKAPEAVTSTTEVEPPRKRKLYHDQAAAGLTKQFNYKNPMQVPRLKKIVVSTTAGRSTTAAATQSRSDRAARPPRRAPRPVAARARAALAHVRRGV